MLAQKKISDVIEAMPKRLMRIAPWIGLAAVALWTLRIFVTPRGFGGGDARWYTLMLADWLTQARGGSFPVWLGQTEYAFNGAVLPLRVAPLYQHWAGVMDLLTWHSLGFYALQNLTIVTLGIAGTWSAYAVMTRICPGKRLLAALCSALYLLCPGTLALVSILDLQMTWSAMPFLPWVFWGLWRAARTAGCRSDWAVVWPLAALWWAHPPTALWATGLASLYMAIIWIQGPWRQSASSLSRCVLFGGLLLAFTVAAQFSLRQPGRDNVAFSALPQPGRIMESVNAAFPGALLPLSSTANAPGDLQLGYALWALLLGSLVTALWKREKNAALMAGSLLGLVLLVLPLPGTEWVWRAMPSAVTRITYYWPMQRIYMIVAAGTVVVGFDVMSRCAVGLRAGAILLALALLGCGWSSYEANLIARAASKRRMQADASERSLYPENRYLTRFAYGQFPSLPERFSSGVMEPWNEFRLVDALTRAEIPDLQAPSLHIGSWSWSVDGSPRVWVADSFLVLQPNRDYLLNLAFPREDYRGLLQLSGRRLYREYILPESGEPGAFGSAKGNDHTIALRIGGDDREDVRVRFISDTPLPKMEPWAYRLELRRPEGPGVDLKSLMPLAMTIRSPVEGLVVTPRMYLAGYSATVDARPEAVERLAHGELAFRVTPGVHQALISYRAPGYLVLAYWITVCTALAGGTIAFRSRAAPARS
jgi:hypothetical protein